VLKRFEAGKLKGNDGGDDRRRKRSPRSPVATWTEQEMVDGKQTPCLSIVLRTRGCSWWQKTGCTFCGYCNDAHPGVGEEDMLAQLDSVSDRFDAHDFVKIYTSGSFLDPDEVPGSVQRKAVELFGQGRLLVESRPEYVNRSSMDELVSGTGSLELALGLESSSNEVLKKSVRKGFAFKDYTRAATTAREAGARVRTYLILKPPFLTESGAVDDTVRSIKDASPYSDVISVNPVNIQARTITEHLWRHGMYATPWLWSVVDVLVKGSIHAKDVRLVSSPTAGGKSRGAHNCGRCDRRVMDSISRFSMEGDVGLLEDAGCDCRRAWNAQLVLEDGTLGGYPDMRRDIRD